MFLVRTRNQTSWALLQHRAMSSDPNEDTRALQCGGARRVGACGVLVRRARRREAPCHSSSEQPRAVTSTNAVSHPCRAQRSAAPRADVRQYGSILTARPLHSRRRGGAARPQPAKQGTPDFQCPLADALVDSAPPPARTDGGSTRFLPSTRHSLRPPRTPKLRSPPRRTPPPALPVALRRPHRRAPPSSALRSASRTANPVCTACSA